MKTWETLLWNFLRQVALYFQEIMYAKNSVLQGASFGYPLSNRKQKKPYDDMYFAEQQTGRPFIVYEVKIKFHESLAVF